MFETTPPPPGMAVQSHEGMFTSTFCMEMQTSTASVYGLTIGLGI